jgi:alcohol dehydrogenase
MRIPEYYEFSCPVKIVSGLKALANLPYELDQLGAKKAMIVTDQGVVGAGLMNRVKAAFEGSRVEIGAIYDRTPPDSAVATCNEVAKLFIESGCDSFVAVGGGSCIDTVKGANMIVTECTDDIMKFQGAERLRKPMKPFIAVPTTAGTGSEVTLVAMIYDEASHQKMAFTSYHLLPKVAILDPKMTLTMPAKITAATGMDALTHAVEGYYCLQKNPVSDVFCKAGIELIVANLVTCIENPGDEKARLAMANGALLAGIGFSNSMVGVVHSLAHATGATARVAHGVANAILLPYGMEYNLKKAANDIAELAPLLGAPASGSSMDRARAAIDAVNGLKNRLKSLAGLPTTLKEAGVKEDQLETIAKGTLNDGAVTYNPEDVTYADALGILRKAF